MRNISLFKYGALAALLGTAFLSSAADAQVLPGQGQPTFINLLDNGAFTVAQRSTTAVSSITTTAKYLWDRWAAYSGTATSATLTNVSSALPTGTGTPVFTAGAQVQRANGQTGVLPVCLVQEISTSDLTPIAGQPVTLSFWSLAGANFSAASSNLTVKITTGTGSDEGLATLISGWAGASTATLNATQTITSSWQRYALTGTLPASATEAAVQICFTPVGTASANDYFQVAGVQLQQGTVPTNFEVRPLAVELQKDYRSFYRLAEPANGAAVNAFGQATGANTNAVTISLPVPMRATTPTITITTAGTFKVNIAGTPTTVATPTAGVCSSNSCTVTAANTNTAGQAEQVTGGGGTGAWDISGDF